MSSKMTGSAGIWRRTTSRLVIGGSVVLVALLLAPSVTALGASVPVGTSSGARTSASPAASSFAAGAVPLRSAANSLLDGQGPAYGAAWSCSSAIGGGSAQCGLASAPGSPASKVRAAAPAVVTTPNWSVATVVPGARWFAMMTYDAADKEVVLFGGVNVSTGYQGDTWVFAAGSWSRLNLSTGPSPRGYGAMAFDYKDRYVVLFGGDTSSSTYSAQTWKFVANKWTLLTPATSPPALVAPSMAWDSNDSYLVLFGGFSGTTTTQDGTWTFVGGSWTHRSTPTHPAGRGYAQMAYDDRSGWIVLFGGYNATSGTLDDTWNFSAGHWTQRHPVGGPSATYAAVMTNDTSDGYLLLEGGFTSTGSIQAKIWSFSNGSWVKLIGASQPPSRAYANAAFDKLMGKVVVFGGYAGPILGSSSATWLYHSGVWTNDVNFEPPDRSMATMAFDAADGYVVLFGGVGITPSGRFSGTTNETWTYVSGHWTRLKLALEPPARFGAAMTYDAGDGYVVLFGGDATVYSASFLNDTWAFSAGKWSRVSVNAAPSGRVYSGLAYDASDGYVVLFGGYGYNASGGVSPLNDTWTFSGGTWTELIADDCYLTSSTCGASPSERYEFAMTYDAADGVVLLFSGVSTYVYEDDTWAFSGGHWYNVTGYSANAPTPLLEAQMTYDAADGYVLLYGGVYSTFSTATWSYSGFAWTLEHPAANPGPDYSGQMAYDGVDGTVVLQGGLTSTNTGVPGNTWLY